MDLSKNHWYTSHIRQTSNQEKKNQRSTFIGGMQITSKRDDSSPKNIIDQKAYHAIFYNKPTKAFTNVSGSAEQIFWVSQLTTTIVRAKFAEFVLKTMPPSPRVEHNLH